MLRLIIIIIIIIDFYGAYLKKTYVVKKKE